MALRWTGFVEDRMIFTGKKTKSDVHVDKRKPPRRETSSTFKMTTPLRSVASGV